MTKEGEIQPRGEFASREAALAVACRLAEADAPSRVVIDNGDGVILAEHLFGSDLTEELNAGTR